MKIIAVIRIYLFYVKILILEIQIILRLLVFILAVNYSQKKCHIVLMELSYRHKA